MARPARIIAAPPDLPGEDDLPYDDGTPVDSQLHALASQLLIELLEQGLSHRPDAYVAGDMGIYSSHTEVSGPRHRAPDVFVVLGTDRRLRKSWVMWKEDWKAPGLVVEMLSPSTEAEDRGAKMAYYAEALRVPEYILFDPDDGRLEGYRLDAQRGRYVRMRPLANGQLRSLVLGLHFGVVPGYYQGYEAAWLRVFRVDGTRVLTTAEAEAERAEAEAQRAEAEAQRAQAEAERADAEARRADQAEAELERLRAAFRALGREP